MGEAMTKDAAACLALRLIGLLILGNGVFDLLELAGQIFVMVTITGVPMDAAISSAIRQHTGALWGSIVVSSLQAIVSLCLAFYFLLRGRVVHRWLTRE